MADTSGVIDAMLTVGGVVGVLMAAICTLSLHSVSPSAWPVRPGQSRAVSEDQRAVLAEAA